MRHTSAPTKEPPIVGRAPQNAQSTLTILHLARRVKRLTGCPGELVFRPIDYSDVEIRFPNVDKAREVLGFEAKVDLDEGLARTIAWYRERQPATA